MEEAHFVLITSLTDVGAHTVLFVMLRQ